MNLGKVTYLQGESTAFLKWMGDDESIPEKKLLGAKAEKEVYAGSTV